MQFNRNGFRGGVDKNERLVEKLEAAVLKFQQEISYTNPIHAEASSIQEVLRVFNEILDDGFKGPCNSQEDISHYWKTLSSVLDSIPTKFANSLEHFNNDNQRATAWMLIELYNRNLHNTFQIILHSSQIIDCYDKQATIQIKSAKIFEVLSCLCELGYVLESKFLEIFEETKEDFEQEVQMESVLIREDSAISQSSEWGLNFYKKKTEDHYEFVQQGIVSVDLMQQFSARDQQVDNTVQDVQDVQDVHAVKYVQKVQDVQEIQDVKATQDEGIVKNVQVVKEVKFMQVAQDTQDGEKSPNSPLKSSATASTTVSAVKQNLERYKTLLGRPTLKDEDEEIHTFVREEYRKDLEEKNKRNRFGFITKALDSANYLTPESPQLFYKKHLRKASSCGDLKAQVNQAQLTSSKTMDLRKSKEPKKSSYEFQRSDYFGVPADLNPFHYDHSDNRPSGQTQKSKENKHSDDDEFESPLGGSYTATELKDMKNSQLLFIQKYQRLQAQYEYRNKPERTITLYHKAREQGDKCFECGAGLNKLMLKFWPRKYYCHYTGYWYCSTCMGKEKHLIPWYAKENFDFTSYHVCKKAREELKRLYDKPTIMIDHKDKAVLENKALYDALVMKRELHLIFDMICESPYVLDLMGVNSNLLLKQNLFSLKNLAEIQSGALHKFMERCYDMLKSHVNGCAICTAKGRICPTCNNRTKLFPFDIKNTSVCRSCKYIYHTRCLKLNKCLVCQHNS